MIKKSDNSYFKYIKLKCESFDLSIILFFSKKTTYCNSMIAINIQPKLRIIFQTKEINL
jgi:hypothetical protein